MRARRVGCSPGTTCVPVAARTWADAGTAVMQHMSCAGHSKIQTFTQHRRLDCQHAPPPLPPPPSSSQLHSLAAPPSADRAHTEATDLTWRRPVQAHEGVGRLGGCDLHRRCGGPRRLQRRARGRGEARVERGKRRVQPRVRALPGRTARSRQRAALPSPPLRSWERGAVA